MCQRLRERKVADVPMMAARHFSLSEANTIEKRNDSDQKLELLSEPLLSVTPVTCAMSMVWGQGQRWAK